MHPLNKEDDRQFQVLVVDRDPHILSQVRRILEQNGYEVSTATSGQSGLTLFQRQPPDLVLLELEIDDVNGLDLLTQMKEKRHYVPVIIMASASETSAIASLRRGADDYLSKPIGPEELLDRVRHNLDKGQQARAQAELTEQLQHQLAALMSVREVAREASSAADLYHLLSRALDQALRSMQLEVGIVFVSEEGELIPLVHRGLPQAIASALTRRRMTWEDPALRPYLEITQAVRTGGEERQGGPLSQSVGYSFTAILPLWAYGQRWGMLEVASREERCRASEDLDTLTTVGQQIAVALANVRLQEAAAMRVRELALLNEACLALTSDLDLEQILTTIMLRTSDVIGVETGSLLLADEESGNLVFRISLGGVAGKVLSQRIPPGEGVAGWVFQNGRSLLVTDVRDDVHYYPEIDHYTGFTTRSILCVPLQVRGKPMGVVELINKTSGDFTGDDLRLLESVAALTATAVEQSRLHEWTTSFILVDPLTRLPNQRFFGEAWERETARSRRYGRSCSLLLIGVDRRLPLSDSRWRELTAILKRALRQSDLLCRYEGGFATILPETAPGGAATLVKRLQEEISRADLLVTPGVGLAEHIRYGVASFPADVADPKDLLPFVENALAQAWQE